MEGKDSTDMEARIIEAAKQVFIRKGYEAATMSDVANEVGIGRTALHYYFRTKDILFDAVFGQLRSAFLPNIDRILDEDSTVLEKMPAIIDCYMRVVRANPLFPNFVIGELKRDQRHLFQAFMKDPDAIQPILRLRKQIEMEMEQGLIKRVPIVDVVTTVVSMVVFPMLIREPLISSFFEDDPDGFEAYMDRRRNLIVEVVTRLLSPDC